MAQQDDDPFQGPEWERFVQDAQEGLLPKLTESAMFMHLQSNDQSDPKNLDIRFALQLGCAILLDKPIVAVAIEGAPVSSRLLRVADEVVNVAEDDLVNGAAGAALGAAIARMRIREGWPPLGADGE